MTVAACLCASLGNVQHYYMYSFVLVLSLRCLFYRRAVGRTLESGSDLARRSDKRPAHDMAR